MPDPSSVTTIACLPPTLISTRILVAPASIEFSTNSFTTEAGPFHHLTGGDFSNETFVENANSTRHISSQLSPEPLGLLPEFGLGNFALFERGFQVAQAAARPPSPFEI